MNNLILLDPYIIERDGPVPPVVWDISYGISYEDIKADRYDETITFLQENMFNYHTLFRSVRLKNDTESNEEMCKMLRFLLANECSIVAIDIETGKIVGVVIMAILWAENNSGAFLRLMSSMRKESGVAKVMEFTCEFMKYSTELPKRLNISRTVHLFTVSIARNQKGKLLNERLLLNAYKVARSVGATGLTWICCSHNDEERAKRVGFKKIDQKDYGTYYGTYTFSRDKLVFDNIHPGNHSATLYGCEVGPRAVTSLGDYLFPEYNTLPDILENILYKNT